MTPDGESGPRHQPAPSSNIATAARAFGDEYPVPRRQWRLRLVGVLLLITTLLYVPWMFGSLNHAALWLAVPFAAANLFSICLSVLAVVNLWSRSVPEPRPLPRGAEPGVAVIVPTCGEPVRWCCARSCRCSSRIGRPSGSPWSSATTGTIPALRAALADLPVVYHSPPPRHAPGRDGAAKAGNLNSAVALIDAEYPHVRYVETRDADDELGSNSFLRLVVGQLEAEERLAFVQTIKEAQVSAGDPFNNRESMFYRGQMLARNAANAVFPCGSGVRWRRKALREIGDFPTWNLVEDLQSGLEALKPGWRGLYLPMMGAVGQHSPEDVPNFYKQRGTWAIDTVRLVVWRGLSGLSVRQRAHFLEMLCFYFNAFTVIVYIPSIVCSLLGIGPLAASGLGYVEHMLPLVLATEAWLLAANMPYNDRRRHQRRPIRALWQVRVIWCGMAPVYVKACLQALLNGPSRKPVYKVTRKVDDLRWHWRHTLPQTVVVVLVLLVMAYTAHDGSLPSPALLIGAAYWGGLHAVRLAGFVARGWRGIRWLDRAARRSGGAPAAAEPEPA